MREARGTLVARLHGWTGAIPLGLFLLLHVVDQALRASAADGTAAAPLTTGLLAHPLTRIVVIGSLCLHVVVGLGRIVRARYDVRRNPTPRNWMYIFQHVTGLLALGFIVIHAIHIVLPLARGQLRSADLTWEMIASLSATQHSIPWLALGYMIGVAACAFHLGNGLWRFATMRGAVKKRGARRGLALSCMLLGLGVLGLGADTTVLLATGSALSQPDSNGPALDPALLGTACPDVSSRLPPAPSAGALTAAPSTPAAAPTPEREQETTPGTQSPSK